MAKSRLLPPIRSSHAIEVAYRRKLDDLVQEMSRSTRYWLSAAYRQHPPRIAQDELPARALAAVVGRLAERWMRRFNRMADDLARYFATEQMHRTDTALRRALGLETVKFKMTAGMRDVFHATVQENVSLIRSIPERYFTQIEGYVQRSVSTGRDLGQLTIDLEREFHVTRRRAALIARDQNNKASANLARARQLELGITQAKWVHSTAGKEPRPTHVKASQDGVVFDLREGWYDPDPKVRKHILPGELINCRCVSRPIIPGFS